MSAGAPQILVVDDEEQLRSLVSYALTSAGMEVTSVGTGREAIGAAAELPIDLIVLDVLLPDADGFDLCRQLRRHTQAPVIFLTVRSDQADVIKGLEAGGDDYLAKPFSIEELLLRISAILRRAAPVDEELRIGALTVNLDSHEAAVDQTPIELTPLEFRFLRYLAVNRHRVVPVGELVEEVWNVPDYGGHDPIVKSTVYRIRQKLGPPLPATIEIRNVRGVGYQVRATPDTPDT
ncbi:MAG: response regulator transcription factor [Actinomycetota bacterium]